MWTKVTRLLKAGFANFIRNGWLSLASITIMVLTLITMSLFLIVNVVLNTGIHTIQDKIDISVYLNDTVEQANVIELQNDLSRVDQVKTIRYVSKNEALDKYKDQNKDNPKLLESLKDTENPLPASLEIKVYDPGKLDQMTAILESEQYKSYIHKISYKENKEIIDKLFKATRFTQNIGLAATLAFTMTALVIIFNTVKMAIFARKEEIDIMKLVGATPGYIKGPFLVEGAIYGIASAIIALLLLTSLMFIFAPTLVHYFGGVGNDASDFLRNNILLLVSSQLLVGIFIGIGSSYLAIRKYLKYA
jgi:cell division transport system permease protein